MNMASHNAANKPSDPVCVKLPFMDYRELGKHNTERSAFVAYGGLVYDVTDFISAHPGGKDILLAALGTDITSTLDSFHDVHVSRLLLSEEFREKHAIRLVATLSTTTTDGHNRIGYFDYQSRRDYQETDQMGDELRHEVFAFLRRERLPLKKSLPECTLLLGLFYAALVACVYFGFIRGFWIPCLALGPVATFMAVNVGHTVMHGGFSRSPVVNLLGRSLWDAGGYASCCWDIEHQGHHQAPHTSIDLQTAPASGMRFFEHQQPRWFHCYQVYYMWLLFVIYSPVSWVMHTYKTLFRYPSVTKTDKGLHVGFKLCFFILPIVSSFWLLPVTTAARNLLVFAVSMSYFSLFTLFIQHEDAYLPEDAKEPWSVRQVVTSVSWRSNSAVFEWFFGYFNYHIEHHLFPGLNPSIYPKIQPIVKSICEKHGVHYKHISYLELFRSQLRAWRRYAIDPINSPSL
jgi:fatty acid desaturase/predicted heme/steroid binding protein